MYRAKGLVAPLGFNSSRMERHRAVRPSPAHRDFSASILIVQGRQPCEERANKFRIKSTPQFKARDSAPGCSTKFLGKPSEQFCSDVLLIACYVELLAPLVPRESNWSRGGATMLA